MSNNIMNSDEEEKLLESYEKDEWQEVKNLDQVKKQAVKAAYEGLPYQTLISSVLHKYSAGH